MELLPRFALLALLVSPAALAEQLYRADMVRSRQVSPLLASQPVPGDRAPGIGRLSGPQRLLPALSGSVASLNPANGYRIEPGTHTYLGQPRLGWLVERATT